MVFGLRAAVAHLTPPSRFRANNRTLDEGRNFKPAPLVDKGWHKNHLYAVPATNLLLCLPAIVEPSILTRKRVRDSYVRDRR